MTTNILIPAQPDNSRTPDEGGFDPDTGKRLPIDEHEAMQMLLVTAADPCDAGAYDYFTEDIEPINPIGSALAALGFGYRFVRESAPIESCYDLHDHFTPEALTAYEAVQAGVNAGGAWWPTVYGVASMIDRWGVEDFVAQLNLPHPSLRPSQPR